MTTSPLILECVPVLTSVEVLVIDEVSAGRCFSTTHDAHASCRSMAQTRAMAQAVETAAALSLARSCGARELPVAELQARLRARGAVQEMPVAVAATPRRDWRKDRI
jgi:hypothetical protein